MQTLARPVSDLSESLAALEESSAIVTPCTRKIAYLLSRYPAVSHTFIFNEIRALRNLGFHIATASINACDRPFTKLPELEQGEYASTFYVKPSGWPKALRAVISSLVRHPIGTLRGLGYAMSLGRHPKRLFYFVEALMIGIWMEEKGLNHLHVHFGMAAASVAMITAEIFPITYSITIHGPDEFYEVSNCYLAEKITTARFICCIGSFARSQLMKLCPHSEWHKIKVVPLGVDPLTFVPRRKMQIDAFEILCVGRLVPAKGQHVLLSAVRNLSRENRAVRLRLLGDGPDRPVLEQRVVAEGLSDHVVFEGAVNQDRIPEFLKEADAFVLASFAEGIPVALMEAMASEIPCLSTVIAGIPELIRDGIDGLLVSPSDEQALTAALRRLMDDPELRRRLGTAGRQRVIERFNLEKNVKALAEVYQCHLP